MWNNIKKRLKSKTHLASLLIGAMGVIELNFHLLQETLGQYYGLTYIGVMLLFVVLRELTTTPVDEK